jgi:hypothetical protein
MVEPWRNEFEEGRSLDLGSSFFVVHATVPINEPAKKIIVEVSRVVRFS